MPAKPTSKPKLKGIDTMTKIDLKAALKVYSNMNRDKLVEKLKEEVKRQ